MRLTNIGLKMKINLIFFLPKFVQGGAGNSIFRLCKGLSKKKFNISIICLKNCPFDKEFTKIGIKIYKIKSNKTFFAMSKVLNTTKSLISEKYKKNIKRFTLRKNIMGYENLFNKL